ncbi:MAG: hypothetical protein J1D77_04270 [Muribaculaceae bacterium]|nr:hypothetical protein [Muribaculaceae bacterium]
MGKLKLFLTWLAFIAVGTANAENYIAIAKPGNVYDEASAKYITVNQYNDDVSVVPGMVFATTEHTPGWFKIEYSPGLHAFVPDQIASSTFKPVGAGSYKVTNNPGQTVEVTTTGNDWSATSNGKTYKGKKWEEILIFLDGNNIAFTVVDIGNGPVAITYDNQVTKFF